jgi:hypothetical protein
MKAGLLVPLLLLPAACMQQAPPEAAAVSAGAAVSCIDLNQIAGRRPESPRYLVFETLGGLVYRNEVQGPCPALQHALGTEILQFEPAPGGRLCRDDSVRVYDASEARATGVQSIPRCRLGAFTPVAPR